MRRMAARHRPELQPVVTLADIRRVREVADAVYLDPKVEEYILDVVLATREPSAFRLERLETLIEYGASPRATIYLAQAAKVHAFMEGRDLRHAAGREDDRSRRAAPPGPAHLRGRGAGPRLRRRCCATSSTPSTFRSPRPWLRPLRRRATNAPRSRAALPEPTLSPELFAKIRGIQIRAQRLVTDLFAGEYESAFKGRGMEFEQVREYLPGDDLRLIDWNVTARMDHPYVKQHREERELTVMLLVDTSASTDFGTTDKSKSEVAAEVAALLAYTAIKSHDRVGLIAFSDQVELYIPPKKGRGHVWRVIRAILTLEPSHRGTDLGAALDYLGRVSRRRAVAFLISDFWDAGFDDRLRVAARRHDLTAIPVLDRREAELPPVGIVELQDAETGEVVWLDTFDRKGAADYRERGRRQRAARTELLRSCRVGEIELWTDEPYVDAIVRYFRARERRRGRGR